MAITKLVSPTTPNPTGTGAGSSWDLAMAQLTAVKKLLSGDQMILTEWTNTTTLCKLAMGSYLQHQGAIYVVDTADYVIPAPVADGTYYIKLTISGETLVPTFITDLTGFVWNAGYNGLYNGDEQVIGYQIVVSSALSVFSKRRIVNLANGGNGLVTSDYLGNVHGASLAVTGAISGASLAMSGAISGASVSTTGNASVGGALAVTGAISGTECITTNGPNKPIDNNGATPPAIGIGGFTYASAKGNDGLTLPSGGTYVVLALSISTGSASGTGVIYRLSGGTSKVFIGSNDNVGYLIMRIG